MNHCPPCPIEFSRGRGTGVAEAIGNWGYSNTVVSKGHELSRMTCLLQRMEELRKTSTCPASPKKKKRPQMCRVGHTPPECRPSWFFPEKSPLIVYTTVAETLLTNNQKYIKLDRINPIPQRNYALQGTDKWYKLGPLCCPQPCCPVPYCCEPEKLYCCYSYCC